MSDELLRRLQQLTIDEPDAALPFHRRLARENGWTDAFALRVLGEYRRFLWLAVRAGHPVTPPPAVDEAWHLHLCYTRSYHDDLCGRVLGRTLHHGPTRGGAAEDAKFAAWYERTLASYRAHFGEPPADVWPDGVERARTGIPRKVDPRTHWVLSKRAVRRAAMLGAAGCAALGLAGCTGMLAITWTETAFLVLVGTAVLAGFVAIVRHLLSAPRPSGHDAAMKSGANKRAGGGSSCSAGCATHHGSGCGSDGGSGCGGGGCGGGGGGD